MRQGTVPCLSRAAGYAVLLLGLAAAAAAGPAAAPSAPGAAVFDASAWRGRGLARLIWLFRVYVGRKPSVAEAERFMRLAAGPGDADRTMLALIGTDGDGGLASSFRRTMQARVSGFVNGTQAAALGGRDGSGRGAALDPGAALEPQLEPLVHTASDDQARCAEAATAAGCFAAWLADWIQPGGAGSSGAPLGRTYLELLQAIAARPPTLGVTR